MIEAKDFYDHGLALHGHKCPAMPMGLRVGAAALNALGVERAADGQLLALVELGEDHCATCFADGVQMVTGCTFGKGNIKKLHYGKWGVTLVEVATGRAVRVTPRAEAMLANKQTSFFKDYREKGIPASQVPLEVVQPLVDRVMNAPVEQLLTVGPVFDHPVEQHAHSFAGLVCEACGEMMVEGYARLAGRAARLHPLPRAAHRVARTSRLRVTMLAIAALVTFVLTTVFSMAGLGAALILIPVFMAFGVEVHTAMATALLLNAVGMSIASATFIRKGLVEWRLVVPMLLVAVALSPVGVWAAHGLERDPAAVVVRGLSGLRRGDDAVLPPQAARRPRLAGGDPCAGAAGGRRGRIHRRPARGRGR